MGKGKFKKGEGKEYENCTNENINENYLHTSCKDLMKQLNFYKELGQKNKTQDKYMHKDFHEMSIAAQAPLEVYYNKVCNICLKLDSIYLFFFREVKEACTISFRLTCTFSFTVFSFGYV